MSAAAEQRQTSPVTLAAWSRIVLMASAAGALVAQVYVQDRGWSLVATVTASCGVIGFVAGTWSLRHAAAAVMLLACVAPGLADLLLSYRAPGTNIHWLALAAGVLISQWRGGWSVPLSWQRGLALWGLGVALTWPIVALRELDFDVSRILVFDLGVTSAGVPPPLQVNFIANVAALTLFAILWIDILFRVARAAPEADRLGTVARSLTLPFAAGAVVAALVGSYQYFVDMSFMNRTFFGAIGRSSGLMLDGNAFGAASAIAAALVLAAVPLERGAAWKIPIGVAALICALGVWASVSRTAMLILAPVVLGLAVAGWRRAGRRSRGAGVAVAVATAALLIVARPPVGGPFARLTDSLGTQAWSRNPASVVRDLIERDGYGTIAHGLIRAFPLAGVGVGTFHAVAIDAGRRYGIGTMKPDNAQNWFRHQLAELGLLGSLGWIVWMAGLATWAVRRRGRIVGAVAFPAALALAGLLLASLVGMPTQNGAVLVGAFTLTAWMVLASEPLVSRGPSGSLPALQGRAGGIVAAIVLGAFVALTAWSAVTTLRIPARAAAFAWPYEEGFYREETAGTRRFRWTGERAVSVFEPGGRYLVLRYQVRHPDVDARPVDVRVRLGGRTVLRTRSRQREIIERYIEMPSPPAFAHLELEVDRTFIAPGGQRPLGVEVEPWTFVDQAPDNTWIYR